MEDKTFVLLEKLYIEMQSIRSEMATKDEMNAGFETVNNRIGSMELSLVRMEDKYDTKLSAVFDGLTANTEAVNSLRTEMKTLETKVDDHEVKLKIVK